MSSEKYSIPLPPPSYQESTTILSSGYNATGLNIHKFKNLIEKYEISTFFANKIRQLCNYKIVLLCDDSSSMNTELKTDDPYSRGITRWEELKQTTSIITEFSTLLDDNGCDIYFLNRCGLLNVRTPEQVAGLFQDKPHGYTPIVPQLRRILQEHGKNVNSAEKKMWVLIATDGEPTDEYNRVNTKQLKDVLQQERNSNKIHVSFLACTDDDSTIEYLQKWDEELKNCDVMDDYKSERQEILRVQGAQFPFSKGDYIAKILLGSIDKDVDSLDEVPICPVNYSIRQNTHYGQNKSQCIVM